MSERIQALINPAILLWAREQRGLPLDVAAERIKVSPQKLAACEQGDEQLSIPQLRTAADFYRRPMAIFYLKEVPQAPRIKVPDFRRLPEAADLQFSPELLLQMRRVREKQEAAAKLAEFGPHFDWSFLGMVNPSESTEVVAAQVRKLLRIGSTDHERWANDYQAFRAWRTALESIGVLVFQVGGISVEEMRGFSLSRNPYPAISVNSKDLPKARIFSLLHEFTHLLLNTSGLCNLKDTTSTSVPQIETFCNYVAGSALIQESSLRSSEVVRKHGSNFVWSDGELTKLSNYFNASQHVVLRRLLTLGLTTDRFYQDKCAEWAQRPLPAASAGGAGETGVEKVLRTQGRNYVQLILSALHSEAITAVNVSEYLDMKLKHLSGLEQEVNHLRESA